MGGWILTRTHLTRGLSTYSKLFVREGRVWFSRALLERRQKETKKEKWKWCGFWVGRAPLASLHALRQKKSHKESMGAASLPLLQEEDVQLTANSLHPGSIATNLLRYHSIIDSIARAVSTLALKIHCTGAATTCYFALNPQVQGVTGKYFCDSNEAKPSDHARDPELAKKLWDFGMNLIQ